MFTKMVNLGGTVSVDTNGQYKPAFDIPFDHKRTDDTVTFNIDGTTAKYRMIYLQRLANPLMAYDNISTNATYNPYRTVDAMAVDLTVFNGLPKLSTATSEPGITTGTTTFESRQRGENNDTIASYLNSNQDLWKQEPMAKTGWDATVRTQLNACFPYGLKHSLGYLNQAFGAAGTLTNSVTGATELGVPQTPFAWFTANNRPFVSPLELLLVPTLSSSKLLVNAGTSSTDHPNYDKYFRILDSSTGATTTPYSVMAGQYVPYPHLLNFFQSGPTTGGTGTAQFHRILEYLGTPSPFVGTEIWTNPTSAVSPYLPPFNRISTYREPGRINLNTIYTQEVFKGLMNGYTSPSWATFVQSRRNDTSPGVLDAPPAPTPPPPPTEFVRPFRSFGGWTMTPTALRPTNEIDCTLLRPDPNSPNQPLFQSPASTAAYNDTNRNPFFRYQGIERLANLVTTRSNVYAVWITVGYFEVETKAQAQAGHTTWNPPATAPPDGWYLGRELGMDTGEIVRHRAFYIIDRTIPVAFQRGQDMNVEKAILINRFIE